MVFMEDSYKSSEPSLRRQDGETEKNIVREYRPRKIPAQSHSKDEASYTLDEPDYAKLFVRDAIRRARDEELAALASLAMIRSGSDERDRILADPGPENTGHLKKPKETLEQIISESEGQEEK